MAKENKSATCHLPSVISFNIRPRVKDDDNWPWAHQKWGPGQVGRVCPVYWREVGPCSTLVVFITQSWASFRPLSPLEHSSAPYLYPSLASACALFCLPSPYEVPIASWWALFTSALFLQPSVWASKTFQSAISPLQIGIKKHWTILRVLQTV